MNGESESHNHEECLNATQHLIHHFNIKLQYFDIYKDIRIGRAPILFRLVQLKSIMQRLHGEFHVFAINQNTDLDLGCCDDFDVHAFI